MTLLLAAAFWRPMWDIDLFWHLEAGRWMVQHLALPSTDIFAYTDPARPWHSFQWAYEVLLYGLGGPGGLQALHLLHVALTAAAFGLLYFHVARRSGHVAAILAVAVLLIGFGDRVRERPDAFNLLFTVAVLPWLFRPGFLGPWRILGLGLLALLWASLHAGGVLLLPVLLGARFAARALLPDEPALTRPGALRQSALEALALLGLPLAPGFLTGVVQAFSMLDASRAFIPEWMDAPTFLLHHAAGAFQVTCALGIVLWPLLALALWLLANPGLRPWGRLLLPALLTLPLCYLATRHVRFLWLPALVPALAYLAGRSAYSVRGYVPAGQSACSVRGDASSEPRASASGPNRATAVLATALLASVLLAFGLHHQVFTLSGGPARALAAAPLTLMPGHFPQNAAGLLRGCGITGKVFNHAPWGGYLLYALGPGTTVFSDGRGNFSPAEAQTLAALDRVSTRRPALEAAHATAPFQLLVHPAPFPLYDFDRARFAPLFLDDVAEVFVALDQPGGPELAARLRTCLASPPAPPTSPLTVLCDPAAPPSLTLDLDPTQTLLTARCLAALGQRAEALAAVDALLSQAQLGLPGPTLSSQQLVRARILRQALQ